MFATAYTHLRNAAKYDTLVRTGVMDMDKKKLRIAENALRQIAMRDGKTVSEVRKEIQKAMLIGLCSQDPKVQAYWKRIPCEGEVPTPEEVIAFLADEAK
jgi:hypothetical protein